MNQSASLYDLSKQYIAGGVNSPVRSFKSVGGNPLFIKKAQGAYIYDVDGKKYIDYVSSWGPCIAGHAHPYIIEKVKAALENGFSYGAPTAIELQLAQKINQYMPSIEKIRFVSSGTEATMSAIRLARGFTKRNKIIKFIGCYHGHADSLLVSAGSGLLTLNIPSSVGVPASFVQETLLADFNDLDAVKKLFMAHGTDIACVIVEPIAGNMNCVLPQAKFLSSLRELCDKYQSLLIFDEVITGFRVALGGAQSYYQVTPDLTTLGKIIGAGMPVGAFGGRKEIMDYLAPLGPVYQAGTLSGNPIAMTAGLANLELLSADNFYAELATKTRKLVEGILQRARDCDIPFNVRYVGSMFGLFFTNNSNLNNESDVKKCDIELFKTFFHLMLEEGIYLAPSAFESGFVSAAHTDADIEFTLTAAERVFKFIKSENKILKIEK